jgi:hypothetical protein
MTGRPSSFTQEKADEIRIELIDPRPLTADEITLSANGITIVRMMTREEFEKEFPR